MKTALQKLKIAVSIVCLMALSSQAGAQTPAASFQTDSAACVNDCITITNNSANATSWQWTFEGGVPTTSSLQNPGNVCYYIPGVYSIKLVATNSNGSDSLTQTVDVHILPSIQVTGGQYCDPNKLDWAQWTSVNGTTAEGIISSNLSISVTQSGGGLGTTGGMYAGDLFPTQYNVPVNSTSIKNTNAGVFTFCFSHPVIDPQIALSSIGDGGLNVPVTTSAPYNIIWAGPGMTYQNDTTFAGQEGYTIVQFPGIHSCISFDYHLPENYCNLAFGVLDTNCQSTTIPPICMGSSATLTATGNTALNNSFSWSPSATLNVDTGATVIATPSVTTTYYATCTAGNCSVIDTVTIVVKTTPPPVPVISGLSGICNGQVDTLTAAGGVSFSWNTGASTPYIIADPYSTNDYVVTVTDTNNCSASTDMLVTETPLPPISISGNLNFCSGTSTTLDAGAGFASYSWSDGETTETISVSTNGVFAVNVANSLGCTAQSAAVNTNIPFLPSAMIQEPDCNNDSVRLGATSPLYTIPQDYDVLDECNYGAYISDFLFAGIDNEGASCPSNVNTEQVYAFYPSMVASVTPGSTYSFTIDPGNSSNWWWGFSFSYAIWIDFNNNGSFDDPGEQVYTTAYDGYDWSSGTYSDNFTIPSNVPSGLTRMRVRMSWQDDFYPGSSNYTDWGETQDYMIQVGSGSSRSYSWTSQPAGFTSNVLNPGITISTDTTYFLTVTDSVSGCTMTTSVEADSSMIVTPASYGNNVWNALAYNYSVNTSGPGDPGISNDTYEGYYTDPNLDFDSQNQWNPNGSPSDYSGYTGCPVNYNYHAVQYKRKGFTAGLYSIDIPYHNASCYLYINDSLVFEDDNCCEGNYGVWTGVLDSITRINLTWVAFGGQSEGALNFNLLGSLPEVGQISGTSPVCLNTNGVNYSVNPVTADYYVWSVPTGATIASGDSTNSITVNFSSNAVSGNVTVYGVSNGLAAGDTSSFAVTVDTFSVATIASSGPTGFCSNGGNGLTLSTTTGVDYLWSTGETTSSIYVTSTNAYSVTVTDTNGCSAASSQIGIVAYPIPSITSTTNDSICGAGTVDLSASASSGTISWYADSTGNSLLATGNSFTTPSISSTTTYYVNATDVCPSTMTAVTATVNAIPSITGTTNGSVCDAGTVGLSASASSGIISWYADSTGDTLLATGNSFTTPTISSTTTYYVNATEVCTSTMSAVTATVNAAPVATVMASGATSFCEGDSVTLSAASDDYALLFTGGTQRVILPFVSPETNYTYELSFKTSDPNSGFSSVRQGDWANNADRMLHLSGGNIHHYIWSNEDIYSTGQNYADNQWHHAVVVVESGVGQFLYVDGILVASGSKDASNLTSDAVIELGATQDWTTNAAIDNVRLWNVVKTQSEIQQLMNTDITGTPAGLIGNWKFNEGTGTTTVNSVDSVAGTLESGASWIDDNTNTYVWSTGETTQSINVFSTGSYSVIVTGASGCSASSAPAAVTVNTTPSITGTAPASRCNSGTVDLGATASAGTLSWYADSTGDTLLATGNLFTTPSISTSTTYYVSATDVCPSTVTAVTATVNALPSVTANTTADSICSGSNVILTGSGASNYTWDNSVTDGVAFTPSATHTYTVTGTDGNNCSATATVDVTVISIPSVASTVNSSVCGHGQVILSGTPGAGYLAWYSDSSGNSLLEYGDSLFTQDISSTTTYYVEAIDNGCISSMTAVTATVNTLPAVAANTTAASVCVGSDITLTGSGASSYIWDNSITDGVAFVPSATHTYTVTGTDGNSCSATATVTVTVNSLPAISANTTASTVCFGSTVTLTGGGATSYIWDGSVTDDVAFTPSATHTYSVTGTDGNGCSATDTVTVTVDSLPTVSANSTASTVCQGSNVTLTGSGASSYTWDSGVTNGVAFADTVTRTYTVTGTSGTGCSATATTTVTVNASPVAYNLLVSDSTTGCGSVTLGSLAYNGIASFLWNNGGTDKYNTVDTSGNYFVIVTDVNGCTGTSITIPVTVNPNPSITASAGGATTFCQGGSVTLIANASTPGMEWSNGATTSSINVTVGGNYTVTATNTYGCTAVSAPTVVTVKTTPSITNFSGASSCSPGAFEIGALASAGTTDWYADSTGGSSLGTGMIFYTPALSSTTTYYAEATSNGCTSTRTAVTATINTPPSVTMSSLSNVGTCNSSFALSGGSPSGGIYSGTGVNNNYFSPSVGAGAYTVTYTYTDNNGCTNADSTTIQVIGATVVSAGTYSTIGTCNSPVNLTNGTPSGGIYSGAGVSNNQFNPSIGVGAHSITYSYTDTYGCSSSDSTIITVASLPVVSFNSLPDVGICQVSFALTGGSPSGGVYSGTAVSSGYFNPSLAGAGSQTLTYTYQDTIYGCSSSATSNINVTGVPSVTAISPASRCDAGSLTLGATPSSGIINWYADTTGNSILNTGTSFVTPSLTSSTTYYAEAALNSCPSHRSGVRAVINQSASRTISANICSGDQFTIGSNSFSTTGIHTAVLSTMNGCDSTITLQLTVGTPITGSNTVTLCAGQSITVGNNTYTSSGNYTDVLTAASGCDSTVTTNLTVNPAVDVTTSVNGGTITANATSASYQWVNCDLGNAIINGETGQSYNATANGDYAVIVTVNNCSDTSSCVNITMTGENVVSQNHAITIYPNPNNGVFNIKASGEVVYSILNELGQTIRTGTLNDSNNHMVDVRDLSSGIYYVVGYDSHTTTKQKIVVAK